MRILTVHRIIAGTLIPIALLATTSTILQRHHRERQMRALEVEREALLAAGRLRAGSDRLTGAVRAFSATGDPRFREEFERELTIDRSRERALETLHALGLMAEEIELVETAKRNSDALIALENRAFAAAAGGDLATAVALAHGEEYRAAKESIVEPIEEFGSRLAERLATEVERTSGIARAFAASAILSVIGCAFAALTALVLYHRKAVVPLGALKRDLDRLVSGGRVVRFGLQDESSEVGEIARSLESYRRSEEEAERQQWVRTSLASLAEAVQGEESPEGFGSKLLSALIPLLGGGCGAFFLRGESDDRFRRLAGHALAGHPLDGGFAVGEGIAGQAAAERRPIVLEEVPADYVRIASGLGAAPPRVLVALPISTGDRVVAVVEVATFAALSPEQRTMLHEATAVIALRLEVLQRNLRTRELLEQVQATESAVRASQQQLRTLVDSIRSVIFMKDLAGRHLLVNAYYEEATGISRDAVLGRTDHEVMAPESADRIVAQDRSVMESGLTATFEETVPAPDGTSRHYLTTKVPLIDPDGAVYGICGIATDITARKDAEERLERANFLANMALDLTNSGYWHVDYSDPEYYYQSERAARIVGEEIKADGRYHLQDEWFSRLLEADPEAAQRTSEQYRGAIEGKYPSYESVYAYKRPSDGRIVWLHALGSLERDADGKARMMYGVYQDITEAKEAEAEIEENQRRLRETEQFFRTVLELAPDGLMVVGRDGEIRLANAQCERLFGYPREELIGRPVEVLVPEEVRAGHPALRESFHREPSPRGMGTEREVAGLRKDGSVFPAEIALSAMPGRDGAGEQVALSIRDITERREQEHALRQAKAKAEEATELKSMFLANMSHEIRTPMNAIIGLSHLALKTSLTPKQRDYIAKVHNAGTALLAIINDILDFSKIEAGKLDIESIDFGLDDVIGSVTTVTAQKAHEKGLEFLADVASEIPEGLRGDPLRLGQVLTNLVNNAIKFTERGEIHLRIELLERTGDRVQLKFSVRDTGIGMTPEQAGRLFQPFSQADMSTTRKHGGTGLGLTICRRLVDLMGGEIWLESVPGAGSTFTFTVWIDLGEQLAGSRLVPGRFQDLRVLVADDNAAAREILVDSLTPLAERVDAVSSGPEAIAAVRERDADSPYDVIFMDWRMPGMDGLQATRTIKEDETLRRTPAIIIVTAFGREEVREEAEKLHVDGFLVKPVTKSMLVDSLVGVFAGGKAERDDGIFADEDSGRLRGLRILLAEDNEINQQIAIELLEGAGATVAVAGTGRVAVDRLSGESPPPFDIVLMDLQMPEMDGYQATARIRSDRRLAALPIIAMTAHATVEERNRCLAAGMNDHVSKPIDPARLYETLERHRPRGTPAGPGARPSAGAPAGEGSRESPGSPGTPAVSQTVAQPGAIGELPSVAGLDVEDGMRRLAGNRELFLSLLRQFVEGQSDAADRIVAALDGGDSALAERLAHTLQGVAGNLGAKRIRMAASELESAIREGTEPARRARLLETVRSAVAELVGPLAAALPRPADAPEAAGPTGADGADVDPRRSRAVVRTMLDLLGEFDPAASDLLTSNRAIFRGILAGRSAAEFESQVVSFDFAGARDRLERAAREKGLLS